MKGMQKIKRGKSFAGVVLYALRSASHHKVAPVVIGGNMIGSFAKELIAEFDATKRFAQMLQNQCGTIRFVCQRTRH